MAGAGTWLAVLVVVSLAVHPEPCPRVATTDIRRSAERAVAWFEVNRLDDGRYRYRWDRDRAGTGYNDVRHAGVMWSLYQASGVGIEGALVTADHGRSHVDAHLVSTPVGPAFGRGRLLRSGATALLVSALDERWTATGSDRDRHLLRRLGHTLAATVGPDGAVASDIDAEDGPVPGTPSPFFTGEVAWALARLHLRFPDDGFDEAALSIRRYVIEERDRRERWFPPVSDHWMAYALATMATWPEPAGTTTELSPPDPDHQAAWLDRQLGLFGVQVRYESQRRGGITSFTRGSNAPAAGVGTLGEGLAGHLAVPGAVQGAERAATVDRLRCVAGLLVSRQDGADDPRTAGAWFRHGTTQMDDQQHALSALLLTEALLSDEPSGGSQPISDREESS